MMTTTKSVAYVNWYNGRIEAEITNRENLCDAARCLAIGWDDRDACVIDYAAVHDGNVALDDINYPVTDGIGRTVQIPAGTTPAQLADIVHDLLLDIRRLGVEVDYAHCNFGDVIRGLKARGVWQD